MVAITIKSVTENLVVNNRDVLIKQNFSENQFTCPCNTMSFAIKFIYKIEQIKLQI